MGLFLLVLAVGAADVEAGELLRPTLPPNQMQGLRFNGGGMQDVRQGLPQSGLRLSGEDPNTRINYQGLRFTNVNANGGSGGDGTGKFGPNMGFNPYEDSESNVFRFASPPSMTGNLNNGQLNLAGQQRFTGDGTRPSL